MPLFIVQNEQSNDVFKHLFQIVEGDGELGLQDTDAAPVGETWDRVEYKDDQTDCSGFAQSRLKKIVNHTSRDIVIRGVDSEHHVQTDDQDPLVAFGGEEIFNVAINKRGGIGFLFNGHDLEITYDVTECDGANYFAFRETGDKIPYPAFVILFHHLFYALRIDETDDESPPIEEVIQAENSLRNQFQCTLKRSADNLEVGCGFDPDSTLPCPGANFHPCQPTDCFIASAAFGSPRAPQVDKFRGIRDVILRQTTLGDAFWRYLYAEYYQFSPQVAIEMGVLPHLRTAISRLVVEPLLDFYDLLERYVRGDWQHGNFHHQVEQVLWEFVKGLPDDGFQPAQAEEIYLEIVHLQERLGEMGVSRNTGGMARPPITSDAVSILGYLAQAVTTQVSSTTYLAWALVTPLRLYWQAVAQLVRFQSQSVSSESRFRGQMSEWLSRAPVPPIFRQLSAEVVLADLSQLADTVFSDPIVRRDFGCRLLESYGRQVPYDLEVILQEAGYLYVSSEWG